MNRLLMVIAFVMGAFVSGFSFASSGGGSDSCGLGWEVTSKKSLLATSTRATTNVTVPPTFGMSSGTSGCDQHTLANRDLPAVQFLATNPDAVLIEMAQGSGENLTALARSLGCSDSALGRFGEMTRAQFANWLDASQPQEIVRRIRVESDQIEGCRG